jgi:hypothetical protein
MAKGKECPQCKEQTYHDSGNYHRCSKCRCIGWEHNRLTKADGPGPGNTCPHCGNMTLHQIRRSAPRIHRCSICGYVTVYAPALRILPRPGHMIKR